MKRLFSVITLLLLLSALALSQVKTGGTSKAGGAVKISAAVISPRAIIFNGTSQNARVTLPNSAPWTSQGAFKIMYRLRTMGANNGVVVLLSQPDDTPIIRLDHTGTRIDLTDNRDSFQVFHTPNDTSNVIMRVQYDPANTRWTVESWTGSCTNYVSNTGTLTTTTAWNFGNWKYNIAANAFDAGREAFHLDWIFMQDGAGATGSGNCVSEPGAGTYLLLHKFDADNGNDTSGNGLNLTLVGTPTFENTP